MEHLWNKLTKKDCLIIVKFISSSIYQYYPIKVLLFLFLLIHISSQVIQIFLFVNGSDLNQFIQYMPVFAFLFFPMFGAITLLEGPQFAQNLFEEINIWPVEMASETTRMKICKEAKITSFFTIINTSATFITSVLVMVCNAHDYDTFLIIKYFDNYWPGYSYILTHIYKGSLVFASVTAFIAHSYQAIYYTQHYKYQVLMLIDQINEIKKFEERDCSTERLIDDVEYQKEIKCVLVSIIKRHQEIVIKITRKIKQVSNYIPGFGLCGLLVVMSVICLLFTGSLGNQYDYRYVPAVFAVSMTTFVTHIMAGQSNETAFEDLNGAIQQINWYTMDLKNRKLYLIMLTYIQKPLKFKFTENYSFNYALGLAIVRGAYSVFSVFISFNNRTIN